MPHDHEMLQPRGPGRPAGKNYPEDIRIELAAGSKARIDTVRGERTRAEFIRAALEAAITRALRRRERATDR